MSTNADTNELSEEPDAISAAAPASAQPAAESESDGGDDYSTDRRFVMFQAMPAWLVSTLVHVLILVILGLVSIADPIQIVNVLTASSSQDNGPEVEELSIEDFDPGELAESEETVEEVEITDPVEMVEPVAMETPVMDIASVPLEMSDFAIDVAPAATSLQSMSMMNMRPTDSRSSDMKKKLLREYGGTESSEAAVTEALKWFSRHQIKVGPNAGAWTFQHEIVCKGACGNGCTKEGRARQLNAATSLALLPFLGAGQTHIKGEFSGVVMAGLRFLVQNGKPGKERGLPYIDYRAGGSMYDHGLAAITLCEAYAMTGDPELAGPAQASLNFISVAQCRDGGWRYGIRDSSGGDTSVVGWQVMALKSGHMGHLIIPPNAIQGSVLFLDKVASDNGSIYGYTGPVTSFRPATSAVGLLCRMYTGWDKNHPGIKRGVQHLAKRGVLKKDLYYDYYAAQVLRHHGGKEWDEFNTELRDWLVETQDQSRGAKGSWFFPEVKHLSDSGRLCLTSFATMILEVYYRHMPLYAEVAAEEEFPL
ncbi:prenyltransferase/squalene oxidase repeat-containing protein [Roseiconus lacunae]|uniref:hypothetical protein n=1 Tax=Roseiconus lacunae TaxID=2605694 RepID=UPI001E42A0A3|nr:hypothetical protein [Roseiconus lacunae]MCD0463171.1 hypothetical protein [Roseiconus lacunae]